MLVFIESPSLRHLGLQCNSPITSGSILLAHFPPRACIINGRTIDCNMSFFLEIQHVFPLHICCLVLYHRSLQKLISIFFHTPQFLFCFSVIFLIGQVNTFLFYLVFVCLVVLKVWVCVCSLEFKYRFLLNKANSSQAFHSFSPG